MAIHVLRLDDHLQGVVAGTFAPVDAHGQLAQDDPFESEILGGLLRRDLGAGPDRLNLLLERLVVELGLLEFI